MAEFYYVLLGNDRGTRIEKKRKDVICILKNTSSKVPPKHTTQ